MTLEKLEQIFWLDYQDTLKTSKRLLPRPQQIREIFNNMKKLPIHPEGFCGYGCGSNLELAALIAFGLSEKIKSRSR